MYSSVGCVRKYLQKGVCKRVLLRGDHRRVTVLLLDINETGGIGVSQVAIHYADKLVRATE